MRCLTPITVPNVHYNADSPLAYRHRRYIEVPCGKCYACQRNRCSQWCMRLQHQAKASSSAFFVTLTYDNEHLPIDRETNEPCFCYRDVQLFLKRLRWSFPHCNIRYFVVSEFGRKHGRPHYHMLLFNVPFHHTVDCHYYLYDLWQFGMIHVGLVNEKTIGYCCKYCFKQRNALKHPMYAEKMRCSSRPFIGKPYCVEMMDFHLAHPDQHFIRLPGSKCLCGMPKCYVNFIFGNDELKHFNRYLYNYYGRKQQRSMEEDTARGLLRDSEYIEYLRQFRQGLITHDEFLYRIKDGPTLDRLYKDKQLREDFLHSIF